MSFLNYTTFSRFKTNHLLFVLTLALTAVFLMAGRMKVTANPMMVMGFDSYGYPLWFMLFIGYAELFGAISLWLKRWALYGAMGLSLILLGATFTHLRMGDPIAMAGPAYTLTPLMILATWYHWSATSSESGVSD